LAPECERYVQPGKAVCVDHLRTREGRDVQAAVHRAAHAAMRAVGPPDDESAEQRRRAADDFRRRIEAGDFRGLFDAKLAEIMAQAAAETQLAEEIGALRVAIARVMNQLPQEDDPTKLVTSLARLTHASVQAHRARHALTGGQADDLSQAITKVLLEIA